MRKHIERVGQIIKINWEAVTRKQWNGSVNRKTKVT